MRKHMSNKIVQVKFLNANTVTVLVKLVIGVKAWCLSAERVQIVCINAVCKNCEPFY